MIRRMTSDDIPEVARLEAEVFSDPWSENVYRQTLLIDGVIYLVVVENGEIIGVCGVRNIVGEGEITNVMIKPYMRGRGLAYEMLTKLLEEGESIGIQDFTLEVRSSNAAAINLYRKLGFSEEGTRPGFYSNPKEDALIMWKRNAQ